MTELNGSPRRVAAAARRLIAARARPVGAFDFSRYFRDTAGLAFYNTGIGAVREVARSLVRANRGAWTADDALAFADLMIADRHLEVKALGIAVLAAYRRSFTPSMLTTWKRWLALDRAANWATTDDICGSLIGPLLVAKPGLVRGVTRWSRHPNLWVRRASAVALIKPIHSGAPLDDAYRVAKALHPDKADLIHKAAGWLLREAGREDPRRLERYLTAHHRAIPRTTFRYAIERFSPRPRRKLMRLR